MLRALTCVLLCGIACGSVVVQEQCRTKLGHDLRRTLWATSFVVLLGTIAAFPSSDPAARPRNHPHPVRIHLQLHLHHCSPSGIGISLARPRRDRPGNGAGKSISYLYLSNIIGSTLGSFLIGFIVLDHWSTQATSTLLLGLGFATYLVLVALSRPIESKPSSRLDVLACIFLALGSK